MHVRKLISSLASYVIYLILYKVRLSFTMIHKQIPYTKFVAQAVYRYCCNDDFSISEFNLHLYSAQKSLNSEYNAIIELWLSVSSIICTHSCI